MTKETHASGIVLVPLLPHPGDHLDRSQLAQRYQGPMLAIRKSNEDFRLHDNSRTGIDHVIMLAAQPGQTEWSERHAAQQITKFLSNDTQRRLLS